VNFGPTQDANRLFAASITVMAAMVTLFNRFVWRRLHALGEARFSLSR
jgi:ABC-type anion transport system duplicated permease subunit